MGKLPRYIILLAGSGIVWRYAMQLMFVWSGAQPVLANPEYQSGKFINAFVTEPLPRMATDSTVLWKGFYVISICLSVAFIIVNRKLSGHWLKRGLVFGVVNWLLMTPWFEFYLPYNVMLEPLPLVLLEALLWLCVTLLLGVYFSFVANWRNVKSQRAPL